MNEQFVFGFIAGAIFSFLAVIHTAQAVLRKRTKEWRESEKYLKELIRKTEILIVKVEEIE